MFKPALKCTWLSLHRFTSLPALVGFGGRKVVVGGGGLGAGVRERVSAWRSSERVLKKMEQVSELHKASTEGSPVSLERDLKSTEMAGTFSWSRKRATIAAGEGKPN